MRPAQLFLALCLTLGLHAAAEAQIRGEIVNGKVVVIADEPTTLFGIDLISADRLLQPVPEPPGPSPFAFFLSNASHEIAWGVLETRVILEGTWVTEAGYTGDSPLSDITALWSNSRIPTPFDVSFVSGAEATIEQQIEENRVRWEAFSIQDYDFEYLQSCECLQGPGIVHVRDGVIESVTDPATGELLDPARYRTLDGLFAATLEQDWVSVQVDFDPTYGFPTRLFLDLDERIADEEFIVSVSGFQAVPEPSGVLLTSLCVACILPAIRRRRASWDYAEARPDASKWVATVARQQISEFEKVSRRLLDLPIVHDQRVNRGHD